MPVRVTTDAVYNSVCCDIIVGCVCVCVCEEWCLTLSIVMCECAGVWCASESEQWCNL